MSEENKNKIEYPAKIIFKAIYRNIPRVSDTIHHILAGKNIDFSISSLESNNNKFVSITITALFPSNDALQDTCNEISSVEGFLMMF